MKVMLVTDSPALTSGSARTCRELASRLFREPRVEVAVAGWFHHVSASDDAFGYRIYPAPKQVSTENPEMVRIFDDFQPDVVVFHGDIFSFIWLQKVKRQVKRPFKSVGYLTIDGKLLREWDHTLSQFDEIISPSEYGVRELERVGYKAKYAPHGVDQDVFRYLDAQNIKVKTDKGDVDQSFICLIDKQNTGRSNIPDAIKAFAKFSEGKDDVHLIINAQASVGGGFNLSQIAKELELGPKVAFVSGCGPVDGVSDAIVNTLYNAARVLLWPSIGDGFGLGLLQAMRTHTIPIATNYSSMTELVAGRGILVDVDRLVVGQYNIERAFFSIDGMVEALESMYYDWKHGEKRYKALVKAGLKFSEGMTWDNCFKHVWKAIVRANRTPLEKIRIWNEITATKTQRTGLVSIITPVYNTKVEYLRQCVESVKEQTYKNVEHILVDDSSDDEETLKYLSTLEKEDGIHIFHTSENAGIVESTKLGISVVDVTSEYIAFLDHDDILFPTAVEECVDAVGDTDAMTYSDEVLVDGEGKFLRTKMKEKMYWELLIQHNQVGHFNLLRKEVLESLKPLDYEGAQDHWLALQMLKDHKLVLVPKILYAYREHKDSVNSTSRLVTATEVGRRMVEDVLWGRRCVGGIYPGVYKPDRSDMSLRMGDIPIVVLSKDNPLYLRNCVCAIQRNTDYKEYSIYIVDTGSVEKGTWDYYKELMKDGIEVLRYPEEYNFSKANNWAVKEMIPHRNAYVFLNDDTIVQKGWLSEMLRTYMLPDAGMVGALLIFPQNEMIQHAGIYFSQDFNGHHHAIMIPRTLIPINACVERKMVSVTGACILVGGVEFREVGGFDEELYHEWQEIGLSMKLRGIGLETYYCPYAVAYHYQGITRNKYNDSVDPRDRNFIFKKYGIGNILKYDPEYQKRYREEKYGL